MRTVTNRRLLLLAASFSLIAASCSSDAADGATPATIAVVETTIADTTEPETTESEPVETGPEEKAPTEGRFGNVTDTVQAFVDAEGLDGAGLIIVERDSGVVYEEYFGGFSADRISMIASSSKMISAGVLLKLQEDGLLDINAPVEDQVDWATGNPDITPAQLLSNSSGLVGLGPDFLYAPYLCQWGVPNTLQECGVAVFSGAADDADQIPPDTQFRYGGAQWQVAGAVAETVSGKSWEQLIDETYVGPCGVDSLGYISLGAVLTGAPGYPTVFGGNPDSVTKSENPNIEGGAYITTGDYAKLLLMHLRGGSCDGTQVLSQESLDTMHADRIAAAYNGFSSSPDFGYGMGWWVDRETGRISDGGAWGAVPWLDLDDGYGAYIIVEDQSETGQSLKGEIEELVHSAVTGS
jgi:CubicO group peptidase (beta-lactamase class C family)